MCESCTKTQQINANRFGRSAKKLTLRPERRFYFDLALKLGIPVGEMLRRMDSAELTEWVAYFKVQEPSKPKASDVLKAQFANRIVRKNNGIS